MVMPSNGTSLAPCTYDGSALPGGGMPPAFIGGSDEPAAWRRSAPPPAHCSLLTAHCPLLPAHYLLSCPPPGAPSSPPPAPASPRSPPPRSSSPGRRRTTWSSGAARSSTAPVRRVG